MRMENAKTRTASYGEFDKTGLSEQISMKLMYMVVDDLPRSFRCVAQNPLSGEVVKSSAAVVTPTGTSNLCFCYIFGKMQEGGVSSLNTEVKCISLESSPSLFG